MKCKLCRNREADKTNTHYLTDAIIRPCLNPDGGNGREEGVYFDLEYSKIESNFQRNSSIDKVDNYFVIITNSWKKIKSKKVLLATWNTYNELWVKWEEEFLGKWVSYCATCDGMFYKWKDVVVVWWWNTAITEALYLANICNKVTVIHRNENFKADDILLEKVKNNPKIELVLNEEVAEITGEEKWDVDWIKLKSWKEIDTHWVFIAIWTTPNNDLINKLGLEKDEDWYLVVDDRQETSLNWIYAAGDNNEKNKNIKQAITSAAEWVIAAVSIHEDLLKEWNISSKKADKNSAEKIEEKISWYKELSSIKELEDFINQDKKVSVTFSASWCWPCQMLKEDVRQNKKYPLAVYDVDLWQEYQELIWVQIKGIPASFIFKNWKIINTIKNPSYKKIIKKLDN